MLSGRASGSLLSFLRFIFLFSHLYIDDNEGKAVVVYVLVVLVEVESLSSSSLSSSSSEGASGLLKGIPSKFKSVQGALPVLVQTRVIHSHVARTDRSVRNGSAVLGCASSLGCRGSATSRLPDEDWCCAPEGYDGPSLESRTHT